MDMGIPIDRLWTVEDVSTYLGVPVKTLYQWKWRGEGPPVRKIGRHLRYDPRGPGVGDVRGGLSDGTCSRSLVQARRRPSV
ncbi:hypothetical protein H4W32_006786 [Actinophytocola algeriensis]|uniref:Helix-turn-helix domain-containing protein n=1 Tax=Actinophytocola algeriensis TaxID=1768010 RepID=A0A7W7VEH5_9PSEU|nr:hypothetical protein [Actinophytocola algeriensis]MBE1478744.1 hypothetical protein [Actinophytocola algeriensis]